MDLNRYLYGGWEDLLFAWLMKFDPDYQAVPWMAERYEANAAGDVYTFYLRPGVQWSNGDAVTAHDFVWSYQRKLTPAVAADYAGFFYDLKNAAAINQGDITDLSQLGVRAKDDHTLECTLEGPRGYFPVLMAYAAAAPSHRASVEQYGENWTEPGNLVFDILPMAEARGFLGETSPGVEGSGSCRQAVWSAFVPCAGTSHVPRLKKPEESSGPRKVLARRPKFYQGNSCLEPHTLSC